jgi:hypothetical protein
MGLQTHIHRGGMSKPGEGRLEVSASCRTRKSNCFLDFTSRPGHRPIGQDCLPSVFLCDMVYPL